MGNYMATYQVDDDAKKGGGPCGKGDPNDFTLTAKETHVSIPNYQAIAASMFKCDHLDKIYKKCADQSAVPFFACKDEMNDYYDCVHQWSTDTEYREQIIKEYLLVREEYRKTGRRRLYRALKGETYVTKSQLKGFQV